MLGVQAKRELFHTTDEEKSNINLLEEAFRVAECNCLTQIFRRYFHSLNFPLFSKWLEILSILGSIFSAKLICVTNTELALFEENNTLQITTLGINNAQTLVHPLYKVTEFIAVQYCIWDRRIWASAE